MEKNKPYLLYYPPLMDYLNLSHVKILNEQQPTPLLLRVIKNVKKKTELTSDNQQQTPPIFISLNLTLYKE
jgi:hypothetical protein